MDDDLERLVSIVTKIRDPGRNKRMLCILWKEATVHKWLNINQCRSNWFQSSLACKSAWQCLLISSEWNKVPNSKTLIDFHLVLFLDCGISDMAQIFSFSVSSCWFVPVCMAIIVQCLTRCWEWKDHTRGFSTQYWEHTSLDRVLLSCSDKFNSLLLRMH